MERRRAQLERNVSKVIYIYIRSDFNRCFDVAFRPSVVKGPGVVFFFGGGATTQWRMGRAPPIEATGTTD